jgi:hypothetical protein
MRKIWGHLPFPSNPHVSRIGAARLPAPLPARRFYGPKVWAFSPERRADISTVRLGTDSYNMRAKFKFKIVLTTVNYCVFCLFRFCKTVFNFKFKLILWKKKIYVNSFLEFSRTYDFKCELSRFGQFSRLRRSF